MCLFILGYVGDTMDTMRRTVDFARELKGMGAGLWFSIAQPLPNTVFFKEAQIEGCIIGDSLDFTNKQITYLPDGVSLSEMQNIVKEATSL